MQIFSPEGDYYTEWGDLYHPMDIFIDAKDRVFVTDQTPRFSVFDLNGKLIDRSMSPDVGHGAWGDNLGNLYMSGNVRSVAKFTKL